MDFIEALDERVLIGLASLDESKLHIVLLVPVDQNLRDQLSAVIEKKCAAKASPRGDLF